MCLGHEVRWQYLSNEVSIWLTPCRLPRIHYAMPLASLLCTKTNRNGYTNISRASCATGDYQYGKQLRTACIALIYHAIGIRGLQLSFLLPGVSRSIDISVYIASQLHAPASSTRHYDSSRQYTASPRASPKTPPSRSQTPTASARPCPCPRAPASPSTPPGCTTTVRPPPSPLLAC